MAAAETEGSMGRRLDLSNLLRALGGLMLGLSWSLASLATAQAQSEGREPNIIIILADDLGVESIQSYGSDIATPNLSRLADSGLQIENAHAMPICTPSRVRLLTGKDSSRNFEDFGHLAESEQTFAHLARDAGYQTLVAGKWQLGSAWEPTIPLTGASPVAAGFQDYIVHNLVEQEVGSRYWGPTLYRNGRRERVEDRLYGSDLVNEHVLGFIEENRNRPFLIFYSMFEPHDPWVLTPDMAETDDVQERYRGMVRYMDKLIGKVIDRLDTLGLREDTLIILTSDNGAHPRIVVRRNGVPRQGGKGTTTRAGTHVPFIVSWPGVVPARRSSDALVDIADIAPTVADLVGRRLDGPFDGLSLLSLMREPTRTVHEAIVHSYRPTGRTPAICYAFDARYKLYEDGRFFIASPNGDEIDPVAPADLSPSEQAGRDRLMAALAPFIQ